MLNFAASIASLASDASCLGLAILALGYAAFVLVLVVVAVAVVADAVACFSQASVFDFDEFFVFSIYYFMSLPRFASFCIYYAKYVEMNACVRTLTDHTDAVSALQLLGDGRLASASHDKTIKIWSIVETNADCVPTLAGQTNSAAALHKVYSNF